MSCPECGSGQVHPSGGCPFCPECGWSKCGGWARVTDEDDAFEFEAKIQRGNGTDDRDTFKARVSANTIDGLDTKVEQMRVKIEDWAVDFRRIQPGDEPELPDDQPTLQESDEA